ncbi:PLP-dependent aminotransferase family protein [Rhodoferax sp.]|uniref:aminotransferase-like domain-containing protein n=1 Tax=Rhodoferax sp. TaxID=50421 RepID=UPI001EB236A9|nr:PLP-dependent aminotransferase family protein [Rhodoferax sp.]MBT9505646.1 PLP-dependent aminotransferase family protein [Rhodoferax sp.]
MNVTKYQALADELARAIGDGKLSPNARLPSVRELMQQHRLSLATVTKSLYVLEQLGLIEPRNKAGFYVKQSKSIANAAVDANLDLTVDGPINAMCNWRPSVDLFPEQRWQSLLGSIIRRHPFLPTRHAQEFGHPRLRAELARRSAENGCFLKEDELIVTQGATEALLLALRATTQAGDRVLVQSPIGVLFRRLLETFTLTPVPILSRVDETDFVAEIQKVLEGENPPKVLLLVANYHFPTGALMPLMAKRNLIRLAEKHALTIIEDDVYGDLQHEGARPLTLKSFDLKGNVIYVNSSSKSLAPGLRIGWLAAGRWRKRIEYFKNASASSVSELSQLVLAEFLAQGSHVPHLRKIRKQLKDRAGEYLSILRLVLGKEAAISTVLGGYSFWLALPQIISADEVRSQIQVFWPLLDSPDSPQIVVVSQGLCFNTSVPLTDPLRQSLTAFCFHLRGLL